MSGWVKIHRKLSDWGWASSTKHFALFTHLLLRANNKVTNWRKKIVYPGQVVTGRKRLAEITGLTERQVRTVLNDLESTNEIKIDASNRFSVITIVNWDTYQSMVDEERPAGDQQKTAKNGKIEKKATSKTTNTECEEFAYNDNLIDNREIVRPYKRPANCPTDVQQATTSKKFKKYKKEEYIYSRVTEHLNLKTGCNYRHTSKKTQSLIAARLNENYSLSDFKKVIDTKTSEWKNTDMEKYLRPTTLFGTNFESYLNQKSREEKIEELDNKLEGLLNGEST